MPRVTGDELVELRKLGRTAKKFGTGGGNTLKKNRG